MAPSIIAPNAELECIERLISHTMTSSMHADKQTESSHGVPVMFPPCSCDKRDESVPEETDFQSLIPCLFITTFEPPKNDNNVQSQGRIKPEEEPAPSTYRNSLSQGRAPHQPRRPIVCAIFRRRFHPSVLMKHLGQWRRDGGRSVIFASTDYDAVDERHLWWQMLMPYSGSRLPMHLPLFPPPEKQCSGEVLHRARLLRAAFG